MENNEKVLITGGEYSNIKAVIREMLQSNIDDKCFNVDTGYTIPEISQNKLLDIETTIKDLKSCKGIPQGEIFVFDSLEPIKMKG